MAKNKKQQGAVDFSEYTPQSKRRNAKENAPALGTGKSGLIIVLVALVVIIVLASIGYGVLSSLVRPQQTIQNPPYETEMVDSYGNAVEGDAQTTSTMPAPDFTMETLDGTKVSLEDYLGKPVILNFWASTCGPCKRELPAFQSAYEEYGDRIQFIMLDCPDFLGETPERARELLEESGYDFPVFFDSSGQAQITYGITSIPQTYLIDAEGMIVGYTRGAIDETMLLDGVDQLL